MKDSDEGKNRNIRQVCISCTTQSIVKTHCLAIYYIIWLAVFFIHRIILQLLHNH